jgi:hypothetical protein
MSAIVDRDICVENASFVAATISESTLSTIPVTEPTLLISGMSSGLDCAFENKACVAGHHVVETYFQAGRDRVRGTIPTRDAGMLLDLSGPPTGPHRLSRRIPTHLQLA